MRSMFFKQNMNILFVFPVVCSILCMAWAMDSDIQV